MPRYFFDLHDGESIPDREGTELRTLEDVRVHAVLLMSDLLRKNPAKLWTGDEWTIEAKTGDGLVLFTLTFLATESPAIQRFRS